jgi:hypothetical protein
MSDASMSKADHRHIFGSEVTIANYIRDLAHSIMDMDLGDVDVDRLARIAFTLTDVFEAAHDMTHASTDTDSRRAYLVLMRLVRELERKTIPSRGV